MSDFPSLLRAERNARRLSQQALGFEADVSTRHLSFLETGRARPSRAMIARLSDAMGLSLRERAGLYRGAGFEPPVGARPIEAPEMRAVNDALDRMMRFQEPFPAAVLTASWRLERFNRGFDALMRLAGVEAAPGDDLLAVSLQSPALRALIPDWAAAGAHLLRRAYADAPDAKRRAEVCALADAEPELADWRTSGEADDAPVLLLRMEAPGVSLAWISVVARFGGPSDITAQELMIEFYHPADAATEAFAREHLAAPG